MTGNQTAREGGTDTAESTDEHEPRPADGETDGPGEDALRERVDRLESLVERQRDRIATLEQAVAGDEAGASLTRRGALTAGGLLALLGVGTGTVSADPQGEVGSSSDPVRKMYTEELNGGVTGGNPVRNINGNGLDVTESSLGIASGGVGSDEIATDAVGTDEIANNAVDTDELASDSVTGPEIAVNAVTEDELDSTVSIGREVETTTGVLSKIETDGPTIYWGNVDPTVTDEAVGENDVWISTE